MYKKFKDLKKGDHIYWVGVNSKTYEPIFCEYELITDMELVEIYEDKVFNIGKKLPIYRCFMIPTNYDPNNYILFVCPIFYTVMPNDTFKSFIS